MQTIELGQTGRETTRLGFGGSSLMGALGRADSLALLEAAYAAGVRHFDVAPSYGFGQAEACLGEFLKHHPGQCTVTTKFGFAPEATRSLRSVARGLARPLLKLAPGLKARLSGAAAAVSGPAQGPNFAPEFARASLENSLRALGVGRIDVWLLHEAEAEALGNESLLRLLEDAVRRGHIGTFGVGSEAARVDRLLRERPAFCPVVQCEWSVLDPLVPPGPEFRIQHRALTANFRGLATALAADAARRKRWSEFTGVDLSHEETLAHLMLKASLVANPAALILFSSKRREHIAANAALVDDESMTEPAMRLYSLVRAEVAAQGSTRKGEMDP